MTIIKTYFSNYMSVSVTTFTLLRFLEDLLPSDLYIFCHKIILAAGPSGELVYIFIMIHYSYPSQSLSHDQYTVYHLLKTSSPSYQHSDPITGRNMIKIDLWNISKSLSLLNIKFPQFYCACDCGWCRCLICCTARYY